MDPDMVRQQEEAEFEQRKRPLAIQRSKAPKETLVSEKVFSLPPEIRTIRVSPKTPGTALKKTPRASRWRIYLQAIFGGTASIGIAVLAGMAFGANHGLTIGDQLWLGGTAGALMGLLNAALPSQDGRFRPVGN